MTRRHIGSALLVFFGLLFFNLYRQAEIQNTVFQVGHVRDIGTIILPFVLTIAVGSVFLFAEFSFGFLAGFYLFVVMAGYFLLNRLSILTYDHDAALACAVVSTVMFLLPALLIRFRPPSLPSMPEFAPDIILGVAIIVLGVAAMHGMHLAGLFEAEQFRDMNTRPVIVNYLIGNVTGALLPFAMACAVVQKRPVLAVLLAATSAAFYPVTMSKLSLLAPLFLLMMAALSFRLPARIATIASLLLPLAIAVALVIGRDWEQIGTLSIKVFSIVGFRLLAVPSVNLDHYYAFFADHPLTYFCHISALKPFMTCPYADQLGTVFAGAYGIGTLNASLFATEGVASVGMLYAPVTAAICGTIIAAGNVASARLSPRFVLISGIMIAVMMRDVPLSVMILTNGYGLILLLWLFAPKSARNLVEVIRSRS